jgi:CBS domain-containing protein
LSPRAACRLETLGFEHVYDYVPGKSDWLARGHRTEGEDADQPRVGPLARDDVVTCRLDEPVGQVWEKVQLSPYRFALVLGAGGTVLGRLRRAALEAEPRAIADEVMEPGPSTVRPDTAVAELRERLHKRDLKTAIVTTPEGRLIGVVRRQALDQ